MNTLRVAARDWLDWDVAMHRLAISIGLMDPSVSFSAEAKHVFWSANVVGESLHAMLKQLVAANILEHDVEEQRVRWNAAFKGSWERHADQPST